MVNDTDGVSQMLSVTGRIGKPMPIPEGWTPGISVPEIYGAFDETIRSPKRVRGKTGDRFAPQVVSSLDTSQPC